MWLVVDIRPLTVPPPTSDSDGAILLLYSLVVVMMTNINHFLSKIDALSRYCLDRYVVPCYNERDTTAVFAAKVLWDGSECG